MTTQRPTPERDSDPEATARIPQLDPAVGDELEDVDPEKTIVREDIVREDIVREDWEAAVIRRIAPRVAAVRSEVEDEAEAEERFGWESESLRRLSREIEARREQ